MTHESMAVFRTRVSARDRRGSRALLLFFGEGSPDYRTSLLEDLAAWNFRSGVWVDHLIPGLDCDSYVFRNHGL